MDKKIIAGGAMAAAMSLAAIIGTVSAQTTADATGLSEAQAIEIALLEVAGEVREVELEKEDGIMVYEVEILTAEGEEVEVEIAAVSGAVLEVETEDDDD